ncbi:MAG: hypothetical protein RMM17_03560 [Acidobacteriota bacterium]|nr:hypothetical protein [Blastocatellia bacterium]MDW8411745.1 hypothetical protein [Acidobacteriota bacterium]
MPKRVWSICLLVCFVVVGASAHHAVLKFNLEEMVATADRIFIGKCIEVREEEELIARGLLPVTTYTFTVSKVLKGEVPERFTFKQLGFRPFKDSGKRNELNPNYYIHGMRGFQVGDELLLMLTPQYMDGNLTYPVGLYQGAFFIRRDSSGRAFARNSINNSGLFSNPYNRYSKSLAEARVIFPDNDQVLQSKRLSQTKVDRMTSKPGAILLEDLVELIEEIVEAERVR